MTPKKRVEEFSLWCRDIFLILALGIVLTMLAKDGCGTGQHPAYVHCGSDRMSR